jgi:TRAP-type C4-dicarboxylate transport system permease small subunit
MAAVNAVMVFVGMIGLLIASFVLTYSVFSRYLFKAATDWQDEVAVFSIVGAVFLAGRVGSSAARTCGHRGDLQHLPPVDHNHVRRVIVDILTLLFCAIFCVEIVDSCFTRPGSTR